MEREVDVKCYRLIDVRGMESLTSSADGAVTGLVPQVSGCKKISECNTSIRHIYVDPFPALQIMMKSGSRVGINWNNVVCSSCNTHTTAVAETEMPAWQ